MRLLSADAQGLATKVSAAFLLAIVVGACAVKKEGIVISDPQPGSDDGEFTVDIDESTFRDKYPALLESDRMLPVCLNSMAGMAVRYRFIRNPENHTVTVLSSKCRISEQGLICGELTMTKRHYFQSPEHQFDLGPDVSFAEAESLYRAYGEDGIAELPEWYQGLSREGISRVERVPEGFQVTFGDIVCAHCVVTIVVRLDVRGDEPVLRLQGEPEGFCI